MAKKTETVETVATVARQSRVQFDGVGLNATVIYKIPGMDVWTDPQRVHDYPQATLDHALQYGLRRLFQDGLAGEIKNGADAEETARGLIDRFTSGDFSRSRSAGGLSMQSVARQLVTAALRAKLGKAPTPEDVKAAVTRVLDSEGNPTGYAKVQAEFERQKAASAESDDLGI